MGRIAQEIRRRWKRVGPETRFFLQRFNVAEALERHRYRREHRPAFPIPPRRLRTLVGPEPTVAGFLAQGQRTAGHIRDALAAAGRDVVSFRSILDFGCGCGRQIRWFADLAGRSRLYGTDICAAAIRWNQSHLPFAEFQVNAFAPPLPYPADHFDLIYAISVFTHLNDAAQTAWIEELARVAAPGAILLLTTHGEFALVHFRGGTIPVTAEFLARLNRHGELVKEGFIFEPDESGGHYGIAFHHIDFIRQKWCGPLRLLKHLPKGMDGWQDVVLLEKPAVSATEA